MKKIIAGLLPIIIALVLIFLSDGNFDAINQKNSRDNTATVNNSASSTEQSSTSTPANNPISPSQPTTPSVSLSPIPTTPQPTPSATVENLDGPYKVLKVTDGDTLSIERNGKSETLRLIGVDTPETVHPTQPVECFGTEASNFTKNTLSSKQVYLEFDPSQGTKDRYQRTLAYVFLADGTNFNLKLIQDGYAYEYTYNIPYKYQKEFKAAQQKARLENKGLWGPGKCE